MSPQEIDSLPPQELVDLLVKNTMELINLTEKSVDRTIISSKRSDVKVIQLAIENKMRVKTHPLLSSITGRTGQLN